MMLKNSLQDHQPSTTALDQTMNKDNLLTL